MAQGLVRCGLYLMLDFGATLKIKSALWFYENKAVKWCFQDIAMTAFKKSWRKYRESASWRLQPQHRHVGANPALVPPGWPSYSPSDFLSLQLLMMFSFSGKRNDAACSVFICLNVWAFIRV